MENPKTAKLLVLDMDGAGANSNQLIDKWFKDRIASVGMAIAKAMFREEFCGSTELVFPEMAKRVTRIVEETECSILWSSDWRNLEKYNKIENAKDMFTRRGLPGYALIGYTPELSRLNFRGDEIRCWLFNNTYGDFQRVAVLDDRKDAGFNLPNNCRFFRTKTYSGLTERITKDIIKYLNDEV